MGMPWDHVSSGLGHFGIEYSVTFRLGLGVKTSMGGHDAAQAEAVERMPSYLVLPAFLQRGLVSRTEQPLEVVTCVSFCL